MSILELTEEQKVPLAAFMFTKEVEHLWHLKMDTLPAQITWDQFLDAFLKSFFLVYVWENKEEEFQDLHQKSMIVDPYASKFI